MSVKSKKNMSSMPTSRFQRFAKQKFNIDPSEPVHIANIIIVLVSTFLQNAL